MGRVVGRADDSCVSLNRMITAKLLLNVYNMGPKTKVTSWNSHTTEKFPFIFPDMV